MVRIESRWNDIVIYMHDLPHVVLKKDLLTGCQSRIEGYGSDETFHIRYHMAKGKDIKSEYWDRSHWIAVLTELKKAELFAT